jgi:hypothetical protein
MISVLPNPPVLPSPRSISDPDTRGWAQSLLNSLQIYLGQVGQAVGGVQTGYLIATPNGLHTYKIVIDNSGNVSATKLS